MDRFYQHWFDEPLLLHGEIVIPASMQGDLSSQSNQRFPLTRSRDGIQRWDRTSRSLASPNPLRAVPCDVQSDKNALWKL
ncbi:hypothetical protein [Terriglobus sp. ADX1]|uniref:hypothetical protein n=1 Tax=Terriglobus sp. ADX1 TaxID=2794063 RepID=UPI002FE6898D